MRGFFTKEETQSLSRSQGKNLSCYDCGLYRGVASPKMDPYGKFEKKILVIGDSPGQAEDERGRPWQGKTGKLLKKTFEKYGIDLFKDCVSLNAINCRPPDNRTPTPHELTCCRDVKVLPNIVDYDPNIIIIVGGSALTSFLGHRWKKKLGGIMKWRGFTIPDKDYKAWVCPIFHPSYVDRMDSKEAYTVWEQDIERIASIIGKKVPKRPKENIQYIDDLEVLNDINEGFVAFDYETTGLKPQAKGHRAVCCAVAYNEKDVYTFAMPEKKKDRQPLIDLLQNKNVGKVASNMKYEDTWTYIRVKYGLKIKGWYWDTMLGAHVLDNRPGITSLKFQAYIRLGIVDYDSEISDYLAPKEEGANNINQVPDLINKFDGMSQLLEYCGRDSLYEYIVAKQQMKEIGVL